MVSRALWNDSSVLSAQNAQRRMDHQVEPHMVALLIMTSLPELTICSGVHPSTPSPVARA